jgi:hypothetical protein
MLACAEAGADVVDVRLFIVYRLSSPKTVYRRLTLA